MRNLFIFLFFSISYCFLSAQEGPAGISTDIEFWISADSLSLNDSDPVNIWNDLSVNANNLTQGNPTNMPTFKLNQLNGHPAVEFNGSNSAMHPISSLTSRDITSFIVFSSNASSLDVIFHTDSNVFIAKSNQVGMGSNNPWKENLISRTNNTFSIYSGTANSISSTQVITSGNSKISRSMNDFKDRDTTTLGAYYNVNTASYSLHLNMLVSEMVVFNDVLNSAKRKIISNYLAAKYNLDGEGNLFAHKTTYNNDVFGIGQESDGSHNVADNNGIISFSNPSSMVNGEYLLIGHNGAGTSTSLSVPAGISERFNQVWRTDETGDVGTIDITFDVSSNNFSTDPNNYVLLIENSDGDFSNGGTTIHEVGRSYNAIDETVTFTGVNFADGAYFTLAEKESAESASFLDFGPGGVGSTNTIASWLDASELNNAHNTLVATWFDLSGNNNYVFQNNSSFQPTYKTNQLNGFPIVEFDGSSSAMHFNINTSEEDLTAFMVLSSNASALQVPLHTDSNAFILKNNVIGMGSNNPWKEDFVSQTNNTYGIYSGTSVNGNHILVSGNTRVTRTINQQTSRDSSSLGAYYNVSNGTYNFHADMDLAELILFNRALNSAERKIVSSSLGAKYDLSSEGNLYSYAATHPNDLIGIGQESDGSHTESRSKDDSLLIRMPSALGNGDYLLIANDDNDYNTSMSVPEYIVERWNRTWRADVTGTPGTINLRFYLGSNGFASPTHYVVIGESNDGDFSNGDASIIGSNPSFSIDGYVEFSGVSLTDGMYFTLAEVNSEATVQDGDWGSTSTWACSCIPSSTENAFIYHDVTLTGDQSVLALTIASEGSLTFNSTETLSIHDDMTFEGSITTNNGTIEALKSTDEQLFYNNTSSIFDFNNLIVNTNTRLELETGAWAVKNNLQVVAGGMDVTDADSVVLYSGSGGSSQILESMSNAFTGDFIVQRYISARSTSYSNQSSPVSGATVADWDDDLYLSGVNGNDPDIMNGMSVFQSVFSFDSPSDSYTTITSTATPLVSGVGYEVYLATTGYFPADTIDYVGTPTTGSVTVSVDQGWNLVGNPYHSFIDYDELTSTGLSATYYIWDTDNGNYVPLTGADPIAPGQGFWVEKNTAGTVNLTFDEDDKINSNATTFYRKKNQDVVFKISNSVNRFSHDLKIRFDANASINFDYQDAKYLKSPIEEAPAILSHAANSNEDLVINTLSNWEESYEIPIKIHAGVAGEYKINVENLDLLQNQFDCILLNDKKENSQIDLNLTEEYKFYSDKGDFDRFELQLSNKQINCEEFTSDDSQNQVLEDNLSLRNTFNNWYLDYEFLDSENHQLEILVYNLNGQLVISPDLVSVTGIGAIAIEGIENLEGIYLIQIKSSNQFINKTVKL